MNQLTNMISGVVQIMGAHDVGKSSLGFQAMQNPIKCAFIDGDEKGRELVEGYTRAGVKFGFYQDMIASWQGKSNEMRYRVLQDTLYKIPEGLDVILWDNWKPVYDVLRPYVGSHQKEFGDGSFWRGDSKIIQGLISKVARQQEADILLTLRNKARLVIVTSHLTDQYMNNAKTGAQIPESSEVFDQMCYARFWLRHNPASPVPIALVAKRISRPTFVEGVGLRNVNVLPQKVTPSLEDQSVWDTLGRYWETPMGNRMPMPEETPTPEELAMLRGVLTPMQRDAWLASVKANIAFAEKDDNNMVEEMMPLADKIAEIKEGGVTALPMVMKALKEAGYTVTPPDVVKYL